MDFKILASLVISNCLEGNTMRNRGAYSTKERMPSVLEPPSTNQPGRLYLIGGVLPSRQKLGIGAISLAHPRFSRMYGVTNSTVFQTAFVLATVLLMSIARTCFSLMSLSEKLSIFTCFSLMSLSEKLSIINFQLSIHIVWVSLKIIEL